MHKEESMNLFGLFGSAKKLKTKFKPIFSMPFQGISPDNAYYRQIQKLIKNIDLDSSTLSLLKISRNIAISSPSIYGYLQLMEGEIYGDKGFILDLDTPNENFNAKIERLWKEWEEDCDSLGGYDFKDFERFVLLHYLRDGECFVYIVENEEGIKLQIIPPENIDFNYNDTLIKKGIEFDKSQQVIAYHVLLDENDKRKRTRIQASDMIHIKRVFQSSQVRGISHLMPVVYKVMQSDKYIESVIAQANIASRLSLIATPKEDTEFSASMGDLQEQKEVESKTLEIEDGRIITMSDNYKIEPLNINHNPNINAFMLSIDRQIAKSLGISYASYTGDLSSVNFSSSRIGVVQERRLFRRIQKLISRKFHSKIYQRFIKNLALRGQISPKEATLALKDYNFKTQGWEYVDPEKEMKALQLQLALGIKTPKEALADRGIELKAQAKDLKESNDVLLRELMRLKEALSPHPISNINEDDESESNTNTKESNEE